MANLTRAAFGGPCAGRDSALDDIGGLAQFDRFNRGPTAGALLTSGIQNDVDGGFAGFCVCGLQDFTGDFDQIALQAAFVPVFEHFADLGWGLAAAVAHQTIGFGDHLHIRVFDTVVYGFNKMPCAVWAKVICTWRAFEICCDGFDHGAHGGPCFWCAANHDGRTVTRTFFATRNAHADVGQACIFDVFRAHAGFVEIRIARIDDRVTLGQ